MGSWACCVGQPRAGGTSGPGPRARPPFRPSPPPRPWCVVLREPDRYCSPPVITVRDLTRRFGPHTAIEGLSFHLERGEVVGFLGPNGAGKSTTMRILSGYLPATSGSAEVAGFDVLRNSLEVRRRIGYLPESVPLYAEHRVEEMLEFQGRLHGLSRSERRARIPRVLERAGIADRSRAIIGALSRGQRQRVGIAVALLPDPEVLILDEPTSGLDPIQRLEMRKLLVELGREHTVLLSSHILPEIEAVCPRVIILSKGSIAADGTQDELVRKLGGGARLRLEALVGPDVATAVRLLKALPGVVEVRDGGRLGIHHVFELPCAQDLREDVGALAHAKRWAIRELSWQRPSLEQLFARIALDLPDDPPSTVSPSTASRAEESPASASRTTLVQLDVSAPLSTSQPAPAAAAAQGKIVYNLNPFDMGASRDLSKPKPIDGPAASPKEDA
ncbi:MAG: ABC transporter ATP-binding protein [Planctomycetes bacterium]|nr:ABC transporter ATP-binding protein [Planctomycetota bacterium]